VERKTSHVSTIFEKRRAAVADAGVIARHRAEMFRDMGTLPEGLYDPLVVATTHYLQSALASEEYVGWLATLPDAHQTVVAGAGLLQRRVPPHPKVRGEERILARGKQGLILNVFTEKTWRRKGAADLLMHHVLAWAVKSDIESLVLHASEEGRNLYERLGFGPTNEMRYFGPLL
jgi:GNAT superfamily N-acetyltransferase